MSDPSAQSGPPSLSPMTFLKVAVWEAVWVLGACIGLVVTGSLVWLIVATPIAVAPMLYVLFKHTKAQAEHRKGAGNQDIVQ
jgi:hypothetical protein